MGPALTTSTAAKLARARAGVVESCLVAAGVGVFEATRAALAMGRHELPAWVVVAGFATLGALPLALVGRAAIAAASRTAFVRAFASAPSRTLAAARMLALVVAALGAGAATFAIAAAMHERYRFHDARAVALLQTVAIGAVLALVGSVLVVGDRRLRRWLHGSAWLDGRRAQLAGAAAVLAALVGPALIVHVAVPAVALGAVVTASLLAVALVTATFARLGTRRWSALASIVLVVGAVVAARASHTVARGRGLAVEQGVLSRLVARAWWSLHDRDRDGYAAASVGGADCDDTNAEIAPGIVEAVGNPVDEDCNGGAPASIGARAHARPPSAAVAPTARPDVVLITVDALRADHVGAWGYARPTTPAIDAFARGATRFARAFTAGPSTRLGLPSLLVGRYASTIRVVHPPALPDVFAAAGYDTGVVACCENLIQSEKLRGFASVDGSAEGARLASPGHANADAVADRALAFVATRRAAQRPFLLWVHFYDPHHPYVTPDGVPSFGDSDIDRYDAEIALADRNIGRVLAALDASTIVVLAADHGDEFGEHGLRFHARSVYNQVIHVPLVIRAPGVPPRVVETPVSLVDVAPTLYDLAGLDTPENLNGVSLAGAMRGQPAPERPLVVELLRDRTIDRDLVAVIARGYKVIWDREANDWSLYSLADRDDRRELSAAQPARLLEMQALLRTTLDVELAQP